MTNVCSVSENPDGAVNQQGSRESLVLEPSLTPQRLHAELLDANAENLEAYLQGALRDGTSSALHGTHRIGQSDRRWLEILASAFDRIGHRSWIYREGRDRNFWVVETTAEFLSVEYDASSLIGSEAGLAYVRGYFDAEGGMPRERSARLYFQITQKDRVNLERVASILASWNISCGRMHNPSRRVDPNYWRIFVSAESHQRFMSLVSSWHPRKRMQIETRMKI